MIFGVVMSGFNDFEVFFPKKKHVVKRWRKMGPKEVNERIDIQLKVAMAKVNYYLYGHLGGENDTE